MLLRPKKRICPSLILVARSNSLRQAVGLKNGSRPSTTSISAKAPSIKSHMAAADCAYFLVGTTGAGAALPRMALKNSLDGSRTITSDLLRKVDR